MLETTRVNSEKAHAFIEEFWLTNGYGPTISEIRVAIGFSSNSVVVMVLKDLKKRGIICLDSNARTIRPANYGSYWKDGKLNV